MLRLEHGIVQLIDFTAESISCKVGVTYTLQSSDTRTPNKVCVKGAAISSGYTSSTRSICVG
jgi:hypothetical protein